MADFLLELLSEEIPARMQEKAAADLARLFTDAIGKAGLKAAAVETFAGPRRLALIARGLPLATEAVSEEVKGPRADAPEQALAGFLGKTGLRRDQLVERVDARGNAILFAVIEKPGRATADVLAEAIPAIVRGFPWPKSMRWGAASAGTTALRWVRPLSGIVALLGGDVVPFTIEGVAAGRETVGHRFHHPGAVTIDTPADYAERLRAAWVIVDPRERQAIIRDRAAALAAEAGLTVIPDEGLVAENAGLTEWPVPLLGRFDPAFLDVPREVIQLTMRTNQKYFALVDGAGALAPNFICTANIAAADGGAAIAAGNAKVLSARLSDAKFFWEQDLKVPLEVQAGKLSGIVFHEKLGTIAAKVERVAKLARGLVDEGIVKGADPDLAEQAARLAKADLVTGMVGEFPELQGVMGGYYAARQGLDPQVADAIRDHYKPAGQGDDVPTAPVTVAVALADKLDTLSLFFLNDMPPTGSKDPYALRRAALGILEIVQRNNLRGGLISSIVSVMMDFLAGEGDKSASGEVDKVRDTAAVYDPDPEPEPDPDLDLDLEGSDDFKKMLEKIMLAKPRIDRAAPHAVAVVAFLADRLKVQQREAGVRHDLIDAVFALGGEDDFVRLLARVKALQSFVATEDGANLLAGYKRAANILRIEEKKDGAGFAPATAIAYDPLPEERALLAALDAAEPAATAAVEAEDFAGAMRALAGLRAPIDGFFGKVTVNDADPDKRRTRLGLLVRIRDAVHHVADFSRIEG